MGVRIIEGHEQGDDRGTDPISVIYCSTTGMVLNLEVFVVADDGTSATEQAQMFLRWLEEDKDIEDLRSVVPQLLAELQAEWFKLEHEDHTSEAASFLRMRRAVDA